MVSVEAMTPERAVEIWEEHLRSIRESLDAYSHYTLDDTWISHGILHDLEESLRVVKEEIFVY